MSTARRIVFQFRFTFPSPRPGQQEAPGALTWGFPVGAGGFELPDLLRVKQAQHDSTTSGFGVGPGQDVARWT